jgi:hypothetical protein
LVRRAVRWASCAILLRRRTVAVRPHTDSDIVELCSHRVAFALREDTTSPAKRLDALQAWNGLGLNNIGK